MNAVKAGQLFFNPLIAWNQLAWRTAETALAASRVVGYRSGRMAISGLMPDVRDQKEFTLLFGEKGQAAQESSGAAFFRVMDFYRQFTLLAMKQMQSGTAALASLAASRSAPEYAIRQSKLMHETIDNAAVAAATLSTSTAKIAGSALKPVRRRVIGNSKRLAKKRR